MNRQTALQRSRQVGIGSLAIGVALLRWPERLGRLAGFDTSEARLVAIGDLAIVPGLLWGRRRRVWMLARGAVNLGIVGLLLPQHAPRARAAAAALCLLTLADLRVAAALREDAATRRSVASRPRPGPR